MDKKMVVARIEELMLEKGISKFELQENAEISNTIYQWKKNAKRDEMRVPSLRSIEKICNYFKISLSYFFSFTAEEQKDSRCNNLIHDITKLNDEELKVIESVVNQFKKHKEAKEE